jgi:hypothetical protein
VELEEGLKLTLAYFKQVFNKKQENGKVKIENGNPGAANLRLKSSFSKVER